MRFVSPLSACGLGDKSIVTGFLPNNILVIFFHSIGLSYFYYFDIFLHYFKSKSLNKLNNIVLKCICIIFNCLKKHVHNFSDFNIHSFSDDCKLKFIDKILYNNYSPCVKNILKISDNRTRSKFFVPRVNKNFSKHSPHFWLPHLINKYKI